MGSRLSCLSMTFGAALLAGCHPLEQAFFGDAKMVVATQVYVDPQPESAPPNCPGAATNVSWNITMVSGLSGGAGFEGVEPDQVLFRPGGFTDDEPPVPQPGACVFRASVEVPEGTFAVEANLTYQGEAWSDSCSLATDINFDGCEAPTWVGFTAAGARPAGLGCSVVSSVQVTPDCEVPDGWTVYPSPVE